MLLLSFWALHTFARERGWLRKKSVRGKHIFLTGAGSGLGRGMAIRFAKRGANLTLSDINEEGLLETKRMIKDETGSDTNILTIKLDISSRQGIKDAAQQGLTKFGEVDILINNAGIVQGKQFTDLNEGLSSKQFVVNLESHFWITSEFLPAMIRRNSGQIVSVASMAGQLGTPFLSDYSAAKAGAIGMMESLRMELKRAGKTGIVCTTICPFFINTGMFDGVRGSILFPFLEQEETIDRMTSSILQNEEQVDIPWRMGFLVHLMKSLFPVALNDYICATLLGWDAMAEFRGRQEKNAIFQTGAKDNAH